MKNPPFFIIGLPRSRTAWLANVLTYGPCFCWHEASRYHASIGDLERELGIMPYDFVGNSDSNLLVFGAKRVFTYFPESKFVFVVRDKVEALESYEKAFPMLKDYSKAAFNRIFEEIQSLGEMLPPGQKLSLGYGELNKTVIINKIHSFVTPEGSFNWERCNMLQQMRVDTIFDKMAENMHPIYKNAWREIQRKQSVLP